MCSDKHKEQNTSGENAAGEEDEEDEGGQEDNKDEGARRAKEAETQAPESTNQRNHKRTQVIHLPQLKAG